jgi:DNA invertase Pin-like site-specific DNA recombinase
MKRAVLYLRVSTIDQTTANQERELREVALRSIDCKYNLSNRYSAGVRSSVPPQLALQFRAAFSLALMLI